MISRLGWITQPMIALVLSGCGTPQPITYAKLYNSPDKPLSDTVLITGRKDRTVYLDDEYTDYRVFAELRRVNGQPVPIGAPITYTGVWVTAGEIDFELKLRFEEKKFVYKNGRIVGAAWQTVDHVMYRETATLPAGKQAKWLVLCDYGSPSNTDFTISGNPKVVGRNPETVAVAKHACYMHFWLSDNPSRIQVGQELKVVKDQS